MHTDFLALLFSSFFLLCFLTKTSCDLLFFVCLATFKIKQIFRLSFLHPIKRKRARKVPVRRSILLAAKKLKTRCVSSSSIYSFVVLFNPPREGERKREKERESDRRLCDRCYSCALNYDSFFSSKIFPPFSSSLSSSFEARAD